MGSRSGIYSFRRCAGGFEAVRAVLKDMPGDMPAAFILILHLDPKNDSVMFDLLGSQTDLEVRKTGAASRSPLVWIAIAADMQGA